MLSVVGLDDAELAKMCEAAAAKTGQVCVHACIYIYMYIYIYIYIYVC
jgi:hypothetical protein